jgi:cytochrome c biogenesis protein CcmG, thiol:disulfide interchange protein DsbE
MRNRILPWLMIFALLVSGCSGERATVANGEAAPGFELEQLAGGTVALDDLRGTVVAVRFWADWCPFCRREMGDLEPVYQRLRGQGLEILAVNAGQERARVERFVERVDYSYPTLLDPDAAVARRYGVIAIPVTYFIDREGIVRGRILGESDAATFERMAQPLLDRPGPGTGVGPNSGRNASAGTSPDAGRRGGRPVGGTPCIHPCKLDGSIPAAATRPPATHLASKPRLWR